MLFTLSYLKDFTYIFDAFKAKSCKICRDVEGMRFKVGIDRVFPHWTARGDVGYTLPLSHTNHHMILTM